MMVVVALFVQRGFCNSGYRLNSERGLAVPTNRLATPFAAFSYDAPNRPLGPVVGPFLPKVRRLLELPQDLER